MALSASAIADSVNAGKTTASAIMIETLAAVSAYAAVQPQAWICHLQDEALLAATEAIDAQTAAGENLLLGRVPFAVKDNIDVPGLPTTAACPEFSYEPNIGRRATL